MALELTCEREALGTGKQGSDLTVAHVVLSLDIGGLERIVLDLIRQAIPQGEQISLVCLERRGRLASDAESAGARIICLDKTPGIRLGLIGKLTSAFRQMQPQVVHTHQIGALFYAGPAARRAGVPVVVHTEHGKHFSPRFKTRMLGKLAGRYCDRFFCVSNDIADEVRHYHIVPKSKISVAPNGINVQQFDCDGDPALSTKLGIPQGSVVVGTVGRLSEIKRQDFLIRAFAKVRELQKSAHLLIVGDGPQQADLKQLGCELGVADQVHFAGYQSEPEKFLALMDVFALTSRSEGMPLSILEAWACALPVVASAVGGLPEMINGTDAGALFPSGDVDALASKLLEFLDNEMLRREFGQRGRKIVQQSYSVEQMADRYHEHYRQLLGIART